jgi:hypothetical protein
MHSSNRCNMYICRLRHINDSVLSSLKMEGIRFKLFCVVLYDVCFVMFPVLFVCILCTEQVPPGGYPIAVKYIILYIIKCICDRLLRTEIFLL